jgi:hypothetical protein
MRKSISARLNRRRWAHLDDGPHNVGVICLNLSKDVEPPVGQSCELIAISSGVEANGGNSHGRSFLEAWELDQRKKNNGVYRFYNVMWIEWHNGIAYRKGLGRVQMDLWDLLDLEEVDITLG